MGDRGITWPLPALLGARIIDDLVVRFGLLDHDSAVVDEALLYLVETRLASGEPVSAGVWRALNERGLLAEALKEGP